MQLTPSAPESGSTAKNGLTCSGGLCSKGLCPGTLLLIGVVLVQGITALVKWINF